MGQPRQRRPAPQEAPPDSPLRPAQRHHPARELQSPRASNARRGTSQQQLARNNILTLQKLNAQPGVAKPLQQEWTLTLRQPASGTIIADQAARSGNLCSRVEAPQQTSRPAPAREELRFNGIRGTKGGGGNEREVG